MSESTPLFEAEEPFALVRTWLAEAEASEPNDANAVALATVDAHGLPNVRVVLLKEIESDGAGNGAFLFYTNYGSAKSQELDLTGKAAFNIHWKTLRRQIRVRGSVEREDGPKADAYYASRPLQSRIGAWASEQSRPLAARADLEAKVAALAAEHGETPPRPPFWGGFRLRPLEIEFWADGAHRLHDRFQWRRSSSTDPKWSRQRLNP